MLTVLFLVVASVSVFGITAFLDAGTRHSLIAFPDSTENPLGAKRWLTPVVGLVNAFVIVVSLKFMWDVRHLKNSD